MSEQEVQEALVVWRFQHEVKRQCDFALKAFGELDAAVRAYKDILGRLPFETVHDEGVSEDSDEAYRRLLEHHKEEQSARESINEHGAAVWFCLQNILVSVANLSKLLWPTQHASNYSHSIKQQLRSSLKVSEDSPLKERALRNHFEHIDERLERWATSTASNMFIDSVILTGASDLHNPELFPRRSVFRHFDPQSKTLSFWGNSYHLQPVLAAVQILSKKANVKVDENPLRRFGFRAL